MGCTNSTQIVHISQNMIAANIRRLRIYSQQKKGKLEAQARTQQNMLIKQLNNSRHQRNFPTQTIIISQIVQLINKMHIYQVIKGHCSKILDNQNHINKKKFAKQSLYPSFKAIDYASKILNDEQVTKVTTNIVINYSDFTPAKDSQIESQIMRHMKKSIQPSKEMINNYVLKLCSQQSMSLDNINQNYHNFRYLG